MIVRHLRLDREGRLDDPALRTSPSLQRLLALLDQDGEQARLVGGAVRNALIGRPIADMDIATTAEPAVVLARAGAARLRAIPTGLAHGTVTVQTGGTAFEVTTLRRDVETDGRHAIVRFSRDFAEDAARRDFTMNALSMTRDGTVHDTVSGLPDLASRRVRFIGEADRRITEDVLRILRFFRFHAAYGTGPPDPEGLAAATRHRDGLSRLSRERVRAEILKLLVAEGAPAAAKSMDEAGIASLVLGGPADTARLSRLAGCEVALGLEPDELLRLAAWGTRDAADVARLRDGLRLSNGEAGRLMGALDARRRLDPAEPPGRPESLALLLACGPQGARDGVLLSMADTGTMGAAAWTEAYGVVAREAPPTVPIGGAEVMARGIRDGRRVGAVLKAFQAAWIRAGFPQDPARLAALLDAAIEETGGV